MVEIACFDDKMTQAQLATSEHQVVVCKGIVQEGRKPGEWRFNLQEVLSLAKVREARQPSLHIEMHEVDWEDSLAENLRLCLGQQKKGYSKLVLWYQQKKNKIKLYMKHHPKIHIDEESMQALQDIKGVSKVYLEYTQ